MFESWHKARSGEIQSAIQQARAPWQETECYAAGVRTLSRHLACMPSYFRPNPVFDPSKNYTCRPHIATSPYSVQFKSRDPPLIHRIRHATDATEASHHVPRPWRAGLPISCNLFSRQKNESLRSGPAILTKGKCRFPVVTAGTPAYTGVISIWPHGSCIVEEPWRVPGWT